ncbi:hypothetical protein ATANTOWER_024352 [Ataeniobius toweri]|uniref:Uncharacterized protein n=1 Tax=Ataeniobius toweri TaxID=208326 RepID=A0ABU7C979_9TELE|nr:hypothetical protein [Ataeniobius toweri]
MLTADLTHMQRTIKDNKFQTVSLFNYGPWRRRPELDTSGGEGGGSARGETTEPGVFVSAVSLIHHGWQGGAKRRALGGRTGFAQLEGSQESQPNGAIRDSVLTESLCLRSVQVGSGETAPQGQNAQAKKCRHSLLLYCPAEEHDELHLSLSSSSRQPHLVVEKG